MFISPIDLLKRAQPLYAVADGRKARTMIDAVRDAMPNPNHNYDSWRIALDSLTEASGSKDLLGEFQEWERQSGRTVEECREVFTRAIPIAERRYKESQQERACYC